MSTVSAQARLCRAFTSSLGAEPDARSLADVIWLAWNLNGTTAEVSDGVLDTMSPSMANTSSTATNGEAGDGLRQEPSELPDVPFDAPDSRVKLFPHAQYPQRLTTLVPATLVRVPAGEALPQRQLLDRALKPFKRRIESRGLSELDPVATADASAECRAVTPIYRATLERWFDVALLVEVSDGMQVWEETLIELQRLLDRHGAFRRVRLWRYAVREGKLVLSSANGAATAPRAINGVRGRCISLFMTNGTSREWQRAPLLRFVDQLGRDGPTAIVQMMPRRAWPHTVLGDAGDEVLIKHPGTATGRLYVHDPFAGEFERADDALTVPLLTLEPHHVKDWARFATAGRRTTHVAVHLEIRNLDSAKGPPSRAPSKEQTPAARLAAFRSIASPQAFQLMRLLAGAPLTLPIMRLMQMGMEGERAQVHLAEVMLSGFVERVALGEGAGSAETAAFEFSVGIREELLRSLSVAEARHIDRSLKPIEDRARRFVEDQTSKAVKDFAALLVDPVGTERLDASVRSFLSVSRRIYEQRGLIQEIGDELPTLASFDVESPSTTRGFLIEEEIKQIAARAAGARSQDARLQTLLIFSTVQQCSWLVASQTALTFLLDDAETRAQGRLVQKRVGWLDALPPDPGGGRDGHSTIGFGPATNRRWFYSQALFPTAASLRNQVFALVPGGARGPIMQMRELALLYEQTRRTVKPGSRRTRAMTDIADRMKSLLPIDALDLSLTVVSKSEGNQLVAVIALQHKFDPVHLHWLVQRLTDDHAFLAFHAANALYNGMGSLKLPALETLNLGAKGAKDMLQSRGLFDGGVHSVLDAILSGIDVAQKDPAVTGTSNREAPRESVESLPRSVGTLQRVLVSFSHGDPIGLRWDVEAALRGQGYAVMGFSPSSAAQAAARNVASCDVFICIACSQPARSPSEPVLDRKGRSVGELEYEEAQRLAKPVLVFMQGGPDDGSLYDLDKQARQLRHFRLTLRSTSLVSDFKTLEDLLPKLASGLTRLADRAFERSTQGASSGNVGQTWEDYFSSGVEQANSRQGHNSDEAALKDYDMALQVAPGNLSGNRRAKLLTYRAAMLKRLGRLQEAEADLKVSLNLATEDGERLDAHYNLACVYALLRRAADMYEHLTELRGSARFRSSVMAHVDDYFAPYKTKPKFQGLWR